MYVEYDKTWGMVCGMEGPAHSQRVDISLTRVPFQPIRMTGSWVFQTGSWRAVLP